MSSLDPMCSRVIMSMESNLPLSADIPDNGVSVEGVEKKSFILAPPLVVPWKNPFFSLCEPLKHVDLSLLGTQYVANKPFLMSSLHL